MLPELKLLNMSATTDRNFDESAHMMLAVGAVISPSRDATYTNCKEANGRDTLSIASAE